MKIFDLFNIKKIIEPLYVSTEKNTETLHALAHRVTDQFTQMQNELQALSAQTQKTLKELSMQTEEVYDCVSGADPASEDDVRQLVSTIIALRDNIEHLHEYSLTRNDEDLLRQVDLLTLVCDRHLSAAGIRKIDREGETFDKKMDIAVEIAHEPSVPPGQNLKTLSGCYQYQGEIVRRAGVIVNKNVTADEEVTHE